MARSRFRHRRGSSEAGLTLMNVLTTVVLAAIVGMLGVPQIVSLTKTFNRFNARNHLLEDLKRAQAETITEGCRGIFRIAADRKSYTYGCDYLQYDPNPEPAADQITFRRNLPDGVTLTATGPIIFDSRGQTIDAAGIVTNITLLLRERSDTFARGTLLGTGVFRYE